MHVTYDDKVSPLTDAPPTRHLVYIESPIDSSPLIDV